MERAPDFLGTTMSVITDSSVSHTKSVTEDLVIFACLNFREFMSGTFHKV